MILPLVRACRPVQWVKNLLVMVPVVTSHRWSEPGLLERGGWAVLAFSLAASSAYLLNDVRDAPGDRSHPLKRRRPIASGALSVGAAVAAAVVLALASAGVAWPLLGPGFSAWLGVYFLLTLGYSLGLKRLLLADVILLTLLYVLRVVAGGSAVGIPPSTWLLAFCTFFFLSLALAKRHGELTLRHDHADERRLQGRGYRLEDLPMLAAIGAGSGVVSVLVLCLYVSSETAARLYDRPELFWLAAAVLLYWVMRYWVLVHRRSAGDDPLGFVLRDPASWATLLLVVGLIVGAAG